VRIAILATFTCAALAAFSNSAQAQKIDIAFGVSTTIAPSASFVDGVETAPSLSGGAFPGVSGDVLFWHNVGVGAEVFWKASQNSNYLGIEGVNYRPVMYNFDAVYSPKLAPHVNLELVAGIGALDTHIYECNFGVGSSCGGTSPVGSSNHFDADFGGGLKLYVRGGFFVRPEARFYWVNNNTDYSGNHFGRVGASIGYTFR
jgi:hypothetical protein